MASMAGAATLKGRNAFAASRADIQAAIDASRVGAPINPMIFGGYMEPATTRVWAEMLTDRKFLNPITDAPTAPANPATRRFAGEPFRPVGPAGTVEMDRGKAFVGTHSPRVKLAGPEPRGIQQSGLRLHNGKAYVSRVWLAGDPGAKIVARLVWGTGANESQTIAIAPLTSAYCQGPYISLPIVQ